MDDRGSLSHCALTCRAWLPRNRFHLFNQITISSPQRLAALLGLLKETPKLKTIIRRINAIALTGSSTSGLQVQANQYSVTILEAAVAVLLSKLPHIDHWQISSVSNDDMYNLPPRIELHRATLACFRQYPSVRSLTLANITLKSASSLVQLIFAFPTLHTLRCHGLQLDSHDQDVRWYVARARLSTAKSPSVSRLLVRLSHCLS